MKPREWTFSGSSRIKPKERFGVFATGPFVREGDNVVHVIEYSAFEAEKEAREKAEADSLELFNTVKIYEWSVADLRAERDKLKAERQVLVDALNLINSEQMQPSGVAYGAMSIAREALKKVNEL